MQAISTKYVGPTSSKGTRIKAFTESGHSVSIPLDYSLSTEGAHAKAAHALAHKLGWAGRWFAGGVKGGYVFVDAGSGSHPAFAVEHHGRVSGRTPPVPSAPPRPAPPRRPARRSGTT